MSISYQPPYYTWVVQVPGVGLGGGGFSQLLGVTKGGSLEGS